MVTLDEIMNKATGLIVDAKDILNDSSVRDKMKNSSYLGEMADDDCYRIALGKAEAAVKILTEYDEKRLPEAEKLVIDLKNILSPPKPKAKPKKETPPLESKVKEETPKKTRRTRRGKR